MTDKWTRIVSGLTKIEVSPLENERQDKLPYERLFQLTIDNHHAGIMEFVAFYAPAVSLNFPTVFIWAGSQLYRQVLGENAALELIELDNELLSIYPLGNSWCLVFEILVEVRSHSLDSILQRFDPVEIILNDWWEAGVLHIQDLRGRSFAFAPQAENDSLLIQIDGEDLEVKVPRTGR